MAKTQKATQPIQQGDVILRPVATLPKGAKRQQTQTVRHGESGHSHNAENCDIYVGPEGVYVVPRAGGGVLTHETHYPQPLPEGTVWVDGNAPVKEWDYWGEEARNVAD